MAESPPPTDSDIRTRQLIFGILVLSVILGLITSAGMLSWKIIIPSAIGYAISLLTLLFLGRMVQSQDRVANALEKLAKREEKDS